MPFMEVELQHSLAVNFSAPETAEVLNFEIISLEVNLDNYGLYFQSETELPTDIEAKTKLINLITEKYVDDVNCVNNKVSLDQFQVNLPVNAMLLKSIDNMQISTHDGFLLIEADPKKLS